MDELDRRLLDIAQREFPICRRPYGVIAGRLGVSEDEAFRRMQLLRERGIVRRLGAVLDVEKLGVVRALVACRVDESRVDEVAGLVNRFDEVTHNYLREGVEFNLWFTVVARDRKSFDEVVDEVRRAAGVDSVLVLEAVRTFKIGAVFSPKVMGGADAGVD